MSVWSRYGRDAVIMPSELKGGKTLAEQFANPIARGTITPSKRTEPRQSKEVEQVNAQSEPAMISDKVAKRIEHVAKLYNEGKMYKEICSELELSKTTVRKALKLAVEQGLTEYRNKRDGDQPKFGQEWVTKIACLYNRTRAGIPTMAKELGISDGTAWRLKQKAIEQGLIKEDTPMNVIKKEQQDTKALTKQPATVDVDQVMLDFETVVNDAEQLFEVAKKHQQAALECVKVLGVDHSQKVLGALWEQLREQVQTL